ncbi:hypothetical protein VKT23_002013 [Stygiomarasmius scandens]|uniref:Yeast cell wall synthesis Kre9/Knh1-like N-terminal domain-containing protein n=1 Tax=Marasmiellus scandens TaxID=2682957 RepID=A0ABR1K0X5_9AGAR
MSTFLALLTLIPLVAGGTFTPTAPGPGDRFKARENCTISWTPSTDGSWKNVSITLMSGSNNNMTLVIPVTEGLDGSNPSLSPFNWPCPEVDPYSAIYFYQFTDHDDPTKPAWTTRFTITSPSGASEPPEHSSQPNGDAIPWGTGSLRNGGNNTTQTQMNATQTQSTSQDSRTETSSRFDKQRKTVSIERQATPTVFLPNSPTNSSLSNPKNDVLELHGPSRVTLFFVVASIYICIIAL